MKGKKALLMDDESRKLWCAEDAEGRAYMLWLSEVLGRWILARDAGFLCTLAGVRGIYVLVSFAGPW